jgi:hypothetical protein
MKAKVLIRVLECKVFSQQTYESRKAAGLFF